MAIQDIQDLMAPPVRRETQGCQGLVVLVPLVILVFLGHQCQVHLGLLDKKGSRDKRVCLVNQAREETLDQMGYQDMGHKACLEFQDHQAK